jgi:hypothetical protein
MSEKEFSIHQQRIWEARPDLRGSQPRVVITPTSSPGLNSGEVRVFGEIKTDPTIMVPVLRNELRIMQTLAVDELAMESVLIGIDTIINEVKSGLQARVMGAYNNGYGPYKSTDWF